MTRSMIDAAWPPSQPPKVSAVAFYIGGGTPHVWTAAEIDDTMRKAGATAKLPIFVRVPPTTRDPHAEADFCVRWAKAHGQPPGTVIALDYETAIDPWWFAFDRTIQAGGYRTLLYGTLRTVVQNVIRLPDGSTRHPSGGYWSAHWTNTPHICPNPWVTATQYGGDVTLGQPWDISLVADTVPLWTVGQSQEDLSIMDDATKAYLDDMKADILGRINRAVQRIGGRTNSVYNNTIDDYQGLVFAKDLQPLDAEAVARLVAGQLEVTGISTDTGGTVTVTFGPATP